MTAAANPTLLAVVRDEDTIALSLSDGEVLVIAAESVPADLPAIGQAIAPATLVQLRAAAERKAIARRLFQLLDRRLYPVVALRRKLRSEGFAADLLEDVLAQFAAKGLHSDERFAEAYCRDTLRRRPVGRRYLLAKLREYGVAEAVCRQVLTAVLPSAREEELALAAGRRRWARLAAGAGPVAEAQVMRFLIGRGFGPGLARRAAHRSAPGQEDGP